MERSLFLSATCRQRYCMFQHRLTVHTSVISHRQLCLSVTYHAWVTPSCLRPRHNRMSRFFLLPLFTRTRIHSRLLLLLHACQDGWLLAEALRLFVQSGRNWFASVPCAITITYERCVLAAQGCGFAHARSLIVRRDRAGWHSASLPARSVYGALSCRESRPVCPSSHGRYDYSPNTE